MAESTPLQFDVPDMNCDACVKSITEAVQRVDKNAHVAADLTTKRVVIGSDAEVQDIMTVIEEAGFSVKAAA